MAHQVTGFAVGSVTFCQYQELVHKGSVQMSWCLAFATAQVAVTLACSSLVGVPGVLHYSIGFLMIFVFVLFIRRGAGHTEETCDHHTTCCVDAQVDEGRS